MLEKLNIWQICRWEDMTQQRHPDIDVFETSSFASLIQQEELEEVIPLDLHKALIGGLD